MGTRVGGFGVLGSRSGSGAQEKRRDDPGVSKPARIDLPAQMRGPYDGHVLEHRRIGDSLIYLDARYFPTIITTWVGTANVENCEWFASWYDAQIDRAIAEGVKIVSISDTLDASRPPPEVRKFFADWMDRLGDRADEGSLQSIAIIPNPLMRGALTAVGWVNPKARLVKGVASLSDALHSAQAAYESRGLAAPPLDLDHYERPNAGAAQVAADAT
jgi:hypothetical protein